MHNKEWETLGKNIQGVIDSAVNSRDFQKMNQNVRGAVDRAASTGSEIFRKAMGDISSGQQTGKKLYASTGGKMVAGVLAAAVGAPMSLLFLTALLGSTISQEPLAAILPVVIFALIMLAIGAWLTYQGIHLVEMVGRFKVYRRMIGQGTYCKVERLALHVGKNVDYVRRDLQRMIRKGFFLEGHLDDAQTALITSDETYRYYELSKQRMEQQKQQQAELRQAAGGHEPQVQEVLDRGEAFLAQIRTCNDNIPGQEISEKISRIELLVDRIFDRADAHPQIVPDLKKLMEYYLPMTVKLLTAYADMDALPVQGENTLSSKREIEETLDTLNFAFEKLLDSIFADTAMDVSSDISVLNTLLAQEGLTEDDISQIN